MKSRRWVINLLFFSLLLIGIFLGRQQTFKRSQGKTDHISLIFQNIVYPPTQVIKNIFDYFDNSFNNIWNKDNLQKECLNLRKQLALFNYNESQLKTLQKENNQLREFLKLPVKFSHQLYTMADVIAYFPYENRITLSKGFKDGLQIGSSIINDKGFVGIIDILEPNTSQAILITSPSLKIGGCIQRDPPTLGLVKGLHSQALCLEILDKNTPLAVGDAVHTTGISKKIPANLLLGWIIEIQEIPEYGTRKVILKPALNILELGAVIILL